MESKPFYQSKTLIGALALLVSFIARFFGKERRYHREYSRSERAA